MTKENEKKKPRYTSAAGSHQYEGITYNVFNDVYDLRTVLPDGKKQTSRHATLDEAVQARREHYHAHPNIIIPVNYAPIEGWAE